MKLSNQFSGDIQLTDWEENLEMGWYVREGIPEEEYFPGSDQGKKGKKLTGASLDCTVTLLQICDWGGDGEIEYNENGGYYDLPEVESDCYTVFSTSGCGGEENSGGAGWSGGAGSGGSTGPGGGGGSGSGGGPTIQPLLEDLLYDKPFALLDSDIPCSLIMQWLEVAKFTPGQGIIDKLNTYTASYPDHGDYTVSDVATIQQIDNAFSKVVNMDYFAVTVSTLPVVNGSTLGPQQFLNYIRTNINSFTDQSLSTFSPLQWGNINDANLWNSGNPYGAVINIDIQGPENGSVVTSLSSPTRWIFTTIRDPKYEHHPVSGNREFGYSVNSNGSYTFYTKGVDRLTNGLETLAQNLSEIPFTNADNLWKSFQNKITEYVNQNGGSATKLNPEILRPDWSDVLDVIDGIKPPSTLSKDC